MKTDHDPTRHTDRRAHAAQAGLAALVAASLLAFSFIAFRTGLGGDVGAGVRARRPAASATQPVVLPGSPRPEIAEPAPAVVAGDGVAPVTTDDAGDVVLGTRQVREDVPAPDLIAADASPAPPMARWLTDRDRRDAAGRSQRKGSKVKPPKNKQTGHEKARGKGHHKNDHNGRHATDSTSPRRSHGASSTGGAGRGRGHSHQARPHQNRSQNEAGDQRRSRKPQSAADKSQKQSRGKGRGKHGR